MSFVIEIINSCNMDYFLFFTHFILLGQVFVVWGKDIGMNKNAFIQQCKCKVFWEVNCYILCSSLL